MRVNEIYVRITVLLRLPGTGTSIQGRHDTHPWT